MAKKSSGGIKGKGKKNGGGGGGSAMAGGTGGHSQQHHSGKLKKGSQFKALHKQRATTAVGEVKRKADGGRKPAMATKRPLRESDEVRSFNERVAGEKKRSDARQQLVAAAKNPGIAPPTFVIAAPTFTFGAPPPAPAKEVAGFQGFISTMTAPKDAPQPRPDPESRRVKPIQPAYQGSNVFAVLHVEEEPEEQQLAQQHALQQQKLAAISQQQAQQRAAAMAAAAQLPPPFLQPATFSFSSVSAFQFQPPVVASVSTSECEIDPDL